MMAQEAANPKVVQSSQSDIHELKRTFQALEIDLDRLNHLGVSNGESLWESSPGGFHLLNDIGSKAMGVSSWTERVKGKAEAGRGEEEAKDIQLVCAFMYPKILLAIITLDKERFMLNFS